MTRRGFIKRYREFVAGVNKPVLMDLMALESCVEPNVVNTNE